MTGWDDRDSGTFFVWEIHEVNGLPSEIGGEVDFVHPKYERRVGGKPVKGDGSKGEAPEQYELNDDELSDTNKATMALMSDTVETSFKTPFITNRVPKKLKPVNNVIGDGDKEVLDKDLSANEKEETGELPGGAWNNLDDQTDDAHLYLSKFRSFSDAIKCLETQYQCRIVTSEIFKLPKRDSSRKDLHMLEDTHNPRCMNLIEIEHNGSPITFLEIDTSDGAAKLSTMMLRTGSSGWLSDNMSRVLQGIMKKSLGWPTNIFKEKLDESDFSGIPHPKSKHSGRLKPEEIPPWAQRFFNWMSRKAGG